MMHESTLAVQVVLNLQSVTQKTFKVPMDLSRATYDLVSKY